MYHFYVLDCCEKTTEPIFKSRILDKMLLDSASYALSYMIVPLPVLEIFPKHICQSYINQPVYVYMVKTKLIFKYFLIQF